MLILTEHVCIAPYFILIEITLWVRKLRFTKVNVIDFIGMDYLLCDQAGLRILSEKHKCFTLKTFSEPIWDPRMLAWIPNDFVLINHTSG